MHNSDEKNALLFRSKHSQELLIKLYYNNSNNINIQVLYF